MKKSVGVSFLAMFLAACADSGQGTPPGGENGTNVSSAITVNEPTPAVSTGAVFEVPARPTPVPEEAAAKPQAIESAPPVNHEAAPDRGLNEQGSQTTSEPRTGDDANPDSVNPRE